MSVSSYPKRRRAAAGRAYHRRRRRRAGSPSGRPRRPGRAPHLCCQSFLFGCGITGGASASQLASLSRQVIFQPLDETCQPLHETCTEPYFTRGPTWGFTSLGSVPTWGFTEAGAAPTWGFT
eukprot:5379246-Prymnesium_polylepis.1